MVNSLRLTSQIHLLAVYDHLHILDEAIDDLKRLRRRRPSLFLSKSVYPLKNRLDPTLSKKLLDKFLCIALSHAIRQ
jgi:hypothetical protein